MQNETVPDKLIVSLATGPYRELHQLAWPSVQAYAERHGYQALWWDDARGERPASWSKLVRLHTALACDYDLVLWLDADVLIVDGERDLADELSPECDFAMVKHATEDGEVPNCGVWLWRKCPDSLELLRTMWGMDDLIGDPWWEQSAWLRLLGHAGGWAARPVRLDHEHPLYRRIQWLDPSWNVLMARDNEVPERVRFAHFSGMPMPQRLEMMRAAAHALETPQSPV